MREREATLRFGRLAEGLRRQSAPSEIIDCCLEAALDEARHALRCNWLATQFGEVPPPSKVAEHTFSPSRLSPRAALLYDVVATCCVAESINSALLLTELDVASDDRVRTVTRELLKDEVAHGQLGWTWLSHEAGRGAARWLSPFLPRMLTLALGAEHSPVGPAHSEDRNALGMLSASQRHEVLRTSVFEVVLPGFAANGLDVVEAVRAVERLFGPSPGVVKVS